MGHNVLCHTVMVILLVTYRIVYSAKLEARYLYVDKCSVDKN